MWSGKAKTRVGIALRWTVMDLHYLVRYLTEWELPLTRRSAAQRAIDAENRQRSGRAA